MVRESPAWRAKDELLRLIPGVDPGTSRTLVAAMGELGPRQAVAMAGLSPYDRCSGAAGP